METVVGVDECPDGSFESVGVGEVAAPQVRFRTPFAYVDGRLPNGEALSLCRLRYGGSATFWGFAVYLASTDRYEDSVLPSGMPIGEPHEALHCACGHYVATPRCGSRI